MRLLCAARAGGAWCARPREICLTAYAQAPCWGLALRGKFAKVCARVIRLVLQAQIPSSLAKAISSQCFIPLLCTSNTETERRPHKTIYQLLPKTPKPHSFINKHIEYNIHYFYFFKRAFSFFSASHDLFSLLFDPCDLYFPSLFLHLQVHHLVKLCPHHPEWQGPLPHSGCS
jgi:hypothetical protein